MKRQKSITRTIAKEKKLCIYEKMKVSRKIKRIALKEFVKGYDKVVDDLFDKEAAK